MSQHSKFTFGAAPNNQKNASCTPLALASITARWGGALTELSQYRNGLLSEMQIGHILQRFTLP